MSVGGVGTRSGAGPRAPLAEPQGARAALAWSRAGLRDQWKDVLRRRLLAGADIGAGLLAALDALLLARDGPTTAAWTLALIPLWVVAAKLHGLYDRDHARIRHLTVDELPSLFQWATICLAVTALAMRALGVDSGGVLTWSTMWLTVFAGSAALRSGARALWRKLVPPDRALVIGDGELAGAFGRKLALEPGHHLEVVRSVDLDAAAASRGDRPAAANGSVAPGELAPLIRSEGIERVVVAVADLDEDALLRVVDACREAGAKLTVAPPLSALHGTAVNVIHLAEFPLIELRTWDVSRTTLMIKRAFDLLVGTVLLVVLLPLVALIAIAVKLDSRGPVFFVQERAGRRGVPFRMVKFRTMVRDAEQRLPELVNVDELREPVFKLERDPRVTRVGRFLRRYSLDELPQLINVVLGQMSMVGPRPEEMRLVERYGEPARKRLEMPPGITGPMQIHGRGELTFEERLALDREYVENYSFQKDINALLQTVSAVVRGKGAF